MGQNIDQFWIEHDEKFWSRTASFHTSYIWTSSAIKYIKSYLWHNLYAKPFTKVLGLLGFRVTSKNLAIGTSESNCNECKHVQRGQRSRLHSDSSEKQEIFYGAAKMHKNSIMGTRFVYNWIDIMFDMGLDNIVHNDGEPRHARIFNAQIEYWKSDILRTRDQKNEQRLLQKYRSIRFLDDDYNQTYMIVPEFWSLKGPPQGIISIVWLDSPLIGGMGIIWT